MIHDDSTRIQPFSFQATWKNVGLVLMLALGLRLLLLGHKSLWLDEAITMIIAQEGQPSIWQGLSLEVVHPPLYYAFVEQWMALSQNEFVLRLPSALWGVLTVWMIYMLGSELSHKRVGLIAALLAALDPFLLWYSQEMRAYSLLCFLGLIIIFATVKLLKRPHLIWGINGAIATLLGLYTHYGVLLLIVVQTALFIIFLTTEETKWRRALWPLCTWIVAFIGYIPWMRTPNFARFRQILTGDAHFFAFNTVQNGGLRPFLIVGALGGIVGSVLFYLWLRWMKNRAYWDKLRDNIWVQRGLVVCFNLILIAAIYPRGYSVRRQFLIIFPYVLLALAWFWTSRVWDKRLLWGVFGLSLIATGLNLLFVPKDQWRDLTHFIGEHYQAGDIVVIEPEYTAYTFDYYNQAHVPTQEIKQAIEVEEMVAQHSRIWIIHQPFDVPQHTYARDWLRENGSRIGTERFYRLALELYE